MGQGSSSHSHRTTMPRKKKKRGEKMGRGKVTQKRILFMRHGETFHNVLHNDEPDTLLTPRGVAQARSWSASTADTDPGHDPAFLSAAEIVLVSPLRRTLQTACYAFAATKVGEERRTATRVYAVLWL